MQTPIAPSELNKRSAEHMGSWAGSISAASSEVDSASERLAAVLHRTVPTKEQMNKLVVCWPRWDIQCVACTQNGGRRTHARGRITWLQNLDF